MYVLNNQTLMVSYVVLLTLMFGITLSEVQISESRQHQKLNISISVLTLQISLQHKHTIRSRKDHTLM